MELGLLLLLGCFAPPSTPPSSGAPVAIVPTIELRSPPTEVVAPPAEVARRSGPVVCGAATRVTGPRDRELRALAERVRLEHPEAFVSVVNTIVATGELPDCYLRKSDAGREGWDRGEPVWRDLPGRAIGGDLFQNRERRLPSRPSGSYAEADLDDDGDRRGAKRLVFERAQRGDAARIWVTVDHYESFETVWP